MGLEDMFISALVVEYENVTSNGTNGTEVIQKCFAKSSLNEDLIHIFDFYLHVVIMLIVIGLGLVGNLLLIWTSGRKISFTSNYFIVLIAIADISVLISYLLYFTLPSTYEYLGFAVAYFKFFSGTQEYVWFIFTTCRMISTYGVLLMLGDRYVWLTTQRRQNGNLSNLTNARLAISLVLALAIMFAFPKMLLFKTTLAHDPCRDIYALDIDTTNGLILNKTFLIAYGATTEFILSYAFPVLCMLPLLRGIHRWKVTWTKQPDLYPRQYSENNSTNHLMPNDRRAPSPESRRTSCLDSSSRTTSEKLDNDCPYNFLISDTARCSQPLLDKVRQNRENSEYHLTNDTRRRLTALVLFFILLESPNHILQLVLLIERIKSDGVKVAEPSTIFVAELLNAASVSYYAIKFYICVFFCHSFKEQCVKSLRCWSGKKTRTSDFGEFLDPRPLGPEYTTTIPMTNTVDGAETPPYGSSENWV